MNCVTHKVKERRYDVGHLYCKSYYQMNIELRKSADMKNQGGLYRLWETGKPGNQFQFDVLYIINTNSNRKRNELEYFI